MYGSDCGVEDSGCIAQGWGKSEGSDLRAPDVMVQGLGQGLWSADPMLMV